ncbi:low temperature requirement protein LtrA [Streptomyces sp. TLI_235]|nr:low temperature requirement protein A [Streptomyces sp. TLI_235]PBC77799.1 low temperature requirement protein LtrA [Streptomyces sp. TLI_235]
MTAADAGPAAADSEERRADWFELFFDLVFVVTVAILARGLHGDPGGAEFGRFLVLFFPAWWAWVNLMTTVNISGRDIDRSLSQPMLIAAMPGLGVMAAAAPDGLGGHAWLYALGAAWVRVVCFLVWLRPALRRETALPLWRPVTYCLVPAALWAVSALVPDGWRFVLWGIAIALEVVLLAVRSEYGAALYAQLSVEHLVERITLFVVIVLGESVFTVVATFADHLTAASGAAALAAFLLVAELAAVFFVWGTTEAARGLGRAQAGDAHRVIRDTVMYLPYFLVVAVTLLAAALGTAVAEPVHRLPAGADWALCAGVLGFYTTNAAIALRYGDPARAVLGWYVPCLVLTAVLLVPGVLLLPAWAAVLCGAAEVFALALLVKHRARRHHPA